MRLGDVDVLVLMPFTNMHYIVNDFKCQTKANNYWLILPLMPDHDNISGKQMVKAFIRAIISVRENTMTETSVISVNQYVPQICYLLAILPNNESISIHCPECQWWQVQNRDAQKCSRSNLVATNVLWRHHGWVVQDEDIPHTRRESEVKVQKMRNIGTWGSKSIFVFRL